MNTLYIVTGAEGFIGRRVVRELLTTQDFVIGVVRTLERKSEDAFNHP